MFKERKYKLEIMGTEKGTRINDQTENSSKRISRFSSILEREEQGISEVKDGSQTSMER